MSNSLVPVGTLQMSSANANMYCAYSAYRSVVTGQPLAASCQRMAGLASGRRSDHRSRSLWGLRVARAVAMKYVTEYVGRSGRYKEGRVVGVGRRLCAARGDRDGAQLAGFLGHHLQEMADPRDGRTRWEWAS